MKKHTEETIKKMREANRKNMIPVAKVDAITGDILEVYESQISASRETGINRGSIHRVLTEERKTAGGFKWVYCNKKSDNTRGVK